MDLNISVEEKAWQYAIDKANTTAKLIWDGEQSRLPEKDRVEFKPVTLWQYVQSRVDEVGQSYDRQSEQDDNQEILSIKREDKLKFLSEIRNKKTI